jgi:Fe-S-cluster containining protein
MNHHLSKLYLELDLLYKDIKPTCIGCKDHDCEGYVWLLKEEAKALFNHNVPIVEINENTFFIHSFEEVEGSVRVDKPRPPCRLRKKGLCSIYDSRPLVCRMYPVGPITIDGEVLIALHKDCRFSRKLQGKDKLKFFNKISEILKQTSNVLLIDILDTYSEVDAISTFPDGPNAFEVIIPLKSLINAHS